MLQRCCHKAAEQRMRPVGSGFQLRMTLSGQEEGMAFELNHFYDASVRGYTGKGQAGFCQDIPIVIIDFVAMSVAFVDGVLSVKLEGPGGLVQDTGIGAQP